MISNGGLGRGLLAKLWTDFSDEFVIALVDCDTKYKSSTGRVSASHQVSKEPVRSRLLSSINKRPSEKHLASWAPAHRSYPIRTNRHWSHLFLHWRTCNSLIPLISILLSHFQFRRKYGSQTFWLIQNAPMITKVQCVKLLEASLLFLTEHIEAGYLLIRWPPH
jgi:hypothetical protein